MDLQQIPLHLSGLLRLLLYTDRVLGYPVKGARRGQRFNILRKSDLWWRAIPNTYDTLVGWR